jgi:hypothetical protein
MSPVALELGILLTRLVAWDTLVLNLAWLLDNVVFCTTGAVEGGISISFPRTPLWYTILRRSWFHRCNTTIQVRATTRYGIYLSS